MADQTSSDDNGVMDYAEHDRTYAMFMVGAKWLTIISCAILIGMAFGFFAGFGLIGGTLVFAVVCILAKIFS